jgi:hypothetical protein
MGVTPGPLLGKIMPVKTIMVSMATGLPIKKGFQNGLSIEGNPRRPLRERLVADGRLAAYSCHPVEGRTSIPGESPLSRST